MGRFGPTSIAIRFTRYGVRQAEQSYEDEQAEGAAMNREEDAGKNAEKVAQIQAKEYEGIGGSLRYGFAKAESYNTPQSAALRYANPFNFARYIGDKVTGDTKSASQVYAANDPDKIQADLQASAEAEQDVAKRNELAHRAAPIIARDQRRAQQDVAAEQEHLAETNAPDAESRERLHSEYQQNETIAKNNQQYDAIEQAMRSSGASQSSPQFLKGIAAVEQQRTTANSLAAGVAIATDERETKAKGQREDRLTAEATEAQQTTAGDLSGARRTRMEEQLKRESEEAHSRSADEGNQFDQTVAPAKRAEFDKQENDKRIADAQRAATEITAIETRANDAREKAAGNTFKAERDARFASIDEQTAKLQEAADREQDVAKKPGLQKVADAQRTAAAVEKKAFDDNAAREDREAADRTNQGTTAEALRDAGLGRKAKEYEELTRDADEARKDDREGRPQAAAAVRQRAQWHVYEAQQGDLEDAHGRDVREEDAGYRASGQGAMAEYNDFREREEKSLREAAASGDPNRMAQAKRTTALDIQGYIREHQEKSRLFGSAEEYSDSILTGSAGDNGTAAALARAGQDANALNGGKGTFAAGNASGGKLDASAKSLGAAASQWQKALDGAVKIALLQP